MNDKVKRIMVDMSATLIHHGHIRILKAAKELGTVIVALTTDEEIIAKKGYEPELNFAERREILEAIRYVDEVVPSPWFRVFFRDLAELLGAERAWRDSNPRPHRFEVCGSIH